MRINQLKAGSILSYVQMALNVVIGLVYTPIMLRLLGKSEFGLYNTVSSTISMLSILNLGFNSSYIRFYSKYKKENDETSIAKLNGMFLLIFLVIGTIAFCCGCFLASHLEYVFADGLSAAEYKTAKVLMLLLTANLALSFPMSVFTSIISAHERFVVLKLLGMLKTILSPLITLPLLLIGYKSIAIVTTTLLISVLTDIAYLFYVKRILHVVFRFHDFEKGLFKQLFSFTFFIALNMVVDQINSNMGKFLLGRMKGTEAVAVYSVGYALYQYYAMFSTAVSGVFSPRIHRIVNSTNSSPVEQKKQLTELFTKVGRVQFMILALVASGVVFFGRPFIVFWAGRGYEEAYVVALLLIIPASIALIQNIGIEVQRAQNKHQFRSIAYIIMALVNLFSTILLCPKYGIVGTVMGTALSLILANGLIMNVYYHKRCNIDILAFWKSILRLSFGLIVPVIFGILFTKWIHINSIIPLLFGILLYSAIYCFSFWFLGMNAFEKALIMKPLRKVLRK